LVEVGLITIVVLWSLSKFLLNKVDVKVGLGGGSMQFQIECNTLKNNQMCLTCNQLFQAREARLIVCSEKGDGYGDVCPECIGRGAHWIKSQLQEFSRKFSEV
jgi:hypothetical protein